MDIISFNEAATANGRIEQFIENPGSTSGIVTVPSTIAVGETVTIPAGRTAVLPNLVVDGTLVVDGEVFVPSGTTLGDLESQIALKAPLASAALIAPTITSPALTNPTINGVAQSGYTGFKNLIINGGFDVWQRGTSFTVASSMYTADRWGTYRANGFVTVTKESDSLYNYAKWAVTTVPTVDKIQPSQQVEKGILPNTTYTVSFLAKGAGNVYDVEFRQAGSSSSTIYNTTALTSSWVKHIFTLTTSSTFNKDEKVAVIIHLSQATTEFNMTQVQLEVGSVATPFEQRPYGLELSLCQRYFEIVGAYSTNVHVDTSNPIIHASHRPFRQVKRVVPSATNCTVRHVNGGATHNNQAVECNIHGITTIGNGTSYSNAGNWVYRNTTDIFVSAEL